MLRAHQAARPLERLEDHAFVAEWSEIVRDRERRAAGADERDPLAVPLARRFRQAAR